MSAIILTNPYPTPSLPAPQSQDAPAPLTIAPVSTGGTAAGTSRLATDTGSGAGKGPSNQGNSVALMQFLSSGKWTRPPQPTGNSVVNAQAQSASGPSSSDMPDPLPTSPFLKRAGEGG